MVTSRTEEQVCVELPPDYELTDEELALKPTGHEANRCKEFST